MNVLERKAFYLAHGDKEIAERIMREHLLDIDSRYAALFTATAAETVSPAGRPDVRWAAVKELRLHGHTDNKRSLAALWKHGNIDDALRSLDAGEDYTAQFEAMRAAHQNSRALI